MMNASNTLQVHSKEELKRILTNCKMKNSASAFAGLECTIPELRLKNYQRAACCFPMTVSLMFPKSSVPLQASVTISMVLPALLQCFAWHVMKYCRMVEYPGS